LYSWNSLMSSLDKDHAHAPENTAGQSFTMQTITVNDIIEQHMEKGKPIDLLSIDVEGHDFEVLQSIDLNRHHPAMIVIEDLAIHAAPLSENKYINYLGPYHYYLAGMDKQNLYFKKNLQTVK